MLVNVWQHRNQIIDPDGYSHVYEHLAELFANDEEVITDPGSFANAVDVLMVCGLFCIENIMSVMINTPEIMNDPVIHKVLVDRDHIYDCHVEAYGDEDAQIRMEFRIDDRSKEHNSH